MERKISRKETSFISDNFDNLKTLTKKERTLLGDLRAAYFLKDLNEFRRVLRRTGYKVEIGRTEENKCNNILYWFRLKYFKTSRNLLFERDNGENLFELILKTAGAGNSAFINLIWTQCELWRKRDFLLKPNHIRKYPIDYVIESNDDGNLFAFLVFDFEGESEFVTKASKKYFLKIKNDQFIQRTGKSLFQKFYEIIDLENDEICFDIMEKLLREMRQIIDIKRETSIDDVFKMENEKYKYKMLKLLITYWKPHSKDYSHYKEVLSEFSPFYKLILTLKENQDQEFKDFFPHYIKLMKEKYEIGRCESKIRRDCNSLLEFAMRNGRRKAIDVILDCEFVDPNKVHINTKNTKFDSKNAHYVMLRLLKKGYYIGNDDEKCVPTDWISAVVMKEFLDSRVQEDGLNGCKIDYNFLINPEIRSVKCPSDASDDVDEKLLFSRSMEPLAKIVNNDTLKPVITHPVLANYITLKSNKFVGIFKMNFFIFMFFYTVPFFMMVTLLPFQKFYKDIFETYGEVYIKSNNKKGYKILGLSFSQYSIIPYWCCVCATAYLTVRESFQMLFVSKNVKTYLKQRSNLFEIVIITCSWILLYTYKNVHSQTKLKTYTPIPSAFIVIFATVELLMILPYPSMTIYMFMLKQVTKTFMKFLTIFILVIIAFTLSFCVVLQPTNHTQILWKGLKKNWKTFINSTNGLSPFAEFEQPAFIMIDTLEQIFDDDSVFQNFKNPFTSFLKTIMMLSGDYAVDPYTLDSFPKEFLLFVFIIASFILFNLINGLAISDIAMLKQHAEFLSLKQQIVNASDTENVICDIYEKFISDDTQTNNEIHENVDDDDSTNDMKLKIKSNRPWYRMVLCYSITLLVRKFPYLHKMNNLCFDFKKRNIKYEQDDLRFNILERRSGLVSKYRPKEKILQELSKIIIRRQTNVKDINEKVESLELELKNMKAKMKTQHEELKKILQDLQTKK